MPLNDSFRKGGAANVVKLATVPSSDDLTYSLANAQKSPRKPVFLAWQVHDERRLLSVTCGLNPSRGDARWILRDGQELNSPIIWSHDTADALMIHTLVSESLSSSGPAASIPEFLRPDYVDPNAPKTETVVNQSDNKPEDAPGSVFADRYEILEEIGKGATSTVYRAKQKQIGRIVALKLMHQHLLQDENNKRRFEQESKSTAALSHPNLVPVHDYGTSPLGRPFIVMDFVDGPSLDTIVTNQGRLTSSQFIEVFTQCSRGLAHAHKKGVIHRDIKPSNIRLYKDDQNQIVARILDFGIAKLFTQDEEVIKMTEVGSVMGSPAFMSPEQSRAESVDNRSDIYSLGVVMFHAATGILPFKGKDIFETLYKHIYDPVPTFASLNLSFRIPEAVEMMIRKSLEKDPQMRYQTMEELQHDLTQLTALKSEPTQMRNSFQSHFTEHAQKGNQKSQTDTAEHSIIRITVERKLLLDTLQENETKARNARDAQSGNSDASDSGGDVHAAHDSNFSHNYAPASQSQDSGASGFAPPTVVAHDDAASLPAPAEEKPVTELDLLKAGKLVSEEDVEKVTEMASKFGGAPSAMLIAEGKVDRQLLDVAKRCAATIRSHKLDVGRAIILLNYAQRARLDFDKALDELGWQLE